MKKLFTTLILALTLLMSSCYVEEYIAHDPSGAPYVTALAPYPCYWTYPRYGTPYYSPNFYRPVPPHRPHYSHPSPPPSHYNIPPRPQQPRPNPNNGQRPPRPQVTPRPSTGNPPPPSTSTHRPSVSPQRETSPSSGVNKYINRR